jgi:GNAT superfamily N-acetyltransferase
VETIDRMLATMRSAFGTMGRRGGRWLDFGGVGAIVMPSVPERSLVNGVIYERGADLESVYPELEAAYAGVQAWTVWVPEADSATAAFLTAKGHRCDANPTAMVLDLGSFDPPGELPAMEDASPALMGSVNDASYPWRDGSLDQAMRGAVTPTDFHLHATGDSCVLGIHDCDGDAGVFFVATLPEARGRGLAGGLLAGALLAARERGCDISTLQATKAGEPVYARLGYQSLGAIGMWEKRAA